MKIAIVGPFPPFIGGTSAFLRQLVSNLEERGYICEPFNTEKGDARKGLYERCKRLLFFFRLGWRVARSDCDIVHCHAVNWANLIGNWIVIQMNRLTGKKTILTLHAGNLLEKFRHPHTRRIVPTLLRAPHFITTVTPELEMILAVMGIRHVRFIPNQFSYVHPDFASPGRIPETVEVFIQEHSPLIVSVGALEIIHGMDILIQALALLKDKYPQIGAILIAFKSKDERFGSELSMLIKQLDLNSSVQIPDNFQEILEVVKKAQVFVRPSRIDGDSIAVREALELGIPTVASNVGFRPDGVFLFKSEDPFSLCEVVQEALTNSHYKAKVDHHDVQKTIDQYLRVYNQLVALEPTRPLKYS